MKHIFSGFGFVEYCVNVLHCFVPGAPEAYLGTGQWDSRAEIEDLAKQTIIRWVSFCRDRGLDMGCPHCEVVQVEVHYPFRFEIKDVRGWDDGIQAFWEKGTADDPVYEYSVVLHQERAVGTVMAFVPGIPMCAATGKDRNDALSNAARAIRLFLDFSHMRLWPLYQTRVSTFSVEISDEEVYLDTVDDDEYFGNDFWKNLGELTRIRALKLTCSDLINIAIRNRFRLEIADSAAILLYDPEQANHMLDVLVIPLLDDQPAPMSLVHWVLRALLIFPDEIEEYLSIDPPIDTRMTRISLRSTGAWVTHGGHLYKDIDVQWFLCGKDDFNEWHPCFYRWICSHDVLDSDTRYRAIVEYHRRYMAEDYARNALRHIGEFNNGTLVRTTVSAPVGIEKLLTDRLSIFGRVRTDEGFGEINFGNCFDQGRLIGRYSVAGQVPCDEVLPDGIKAFQGTPE